MWHDLIKAAFDAVKDACRPENIVQQAVDLANDHPGETIELAFMLAEKAKEKVKEVFNDKL
ncbi:MAG: hypothetical protein IJU48_10105 [Synergistaceae bacterium]|nr:hypothetical protein [Synergistaceae bacterium]